MFYNTLPDGSIYLTAPVLIPEAKDCDYHNGETPLHKEQIAAFKKSYDKYGFVDHEHTITVNGRKIGEPYKSELLSHDTTFTLYDGTTKTYPSGTWMLTTHITDTESVETAMKGGYTGYSPSIIPRASADKYLQALKKKKCACKDKINSQGNSLIKDVPDPVVLSVSLTKQPCLHESKFCEISDNMEEEVSLKSKILNAMGMKEEAEVEALKSEVSELKAEVEVLKEIIAKLPEEFKQTLAEALKPVETDSSEKPKEEEEEKSSEEKEEEEEKEKGKVAEKSEAEPVDAKVEEDNEHQEEEEVETVAEKGESKAAPIHDHVETAQKSTKSIYELMGRNPNGTRKRH